MDDFESTERTPRDDDARGCPRSVPPFRWESSPQQYVSSRMCTMCLSWHLLFRSFLPDHVNGATSDAPQPGWERNETYSTVGRIHPLNVLISFDYSAIASCRCRRQPRSPGDRPSSSKSICVRRQRVRPASLSPRSLCLSANRNPPLTWTFASVDM